MIKNGKRVCLFRALHVSCFKMKLQNNLGHLGFYAAQLTPMISIGFDSVK